MKNIVVIQCVLLVVVTWSLGTAARGDEAIKKQILKLFPQADTNKDGVISDAEEAVVSRQALKRYPQADKDGDGVLSTAEKKALLRAAANRAKRKPAGGKGFGAQVSESLMRSNPALEAFGNAKTVRTPAGQRAWPYSAESSRHTAANV